MKKMWAAGSSLVLIAAMAGSSAFAGTFTLSGTAHEIFNGPPTDPGVVDITTSTGTSGAILYDTSAAAVPFDQFTHLSLDFSLPVGFQTLQSPRLTLAHFGPTGFQYVYVTLTPQPINATFASTGNLIDLNATAPVWDLHELSESPDASALTYAEALGVLRKIDFEFVSLDLDAGNIFDQEMYADNFQVNNDIFSVPNVAPEPASLTLLTLGALLLLPRRPQRKPKP